MTKKTDPQPATDGTKILFLVVWSGGYEPPSYKAVQTRDDALEQAYTWMEDWDEEQDLIDVLRVDLDNFTVERETFDLPEKE